MTVLRPGLLETKLPAHGLRGFPVQLTAEGPEQLRDALVKHFDHSGDGAITSSDFETAQRVGASQSVIIRDLNGDRVHLRGVEQIGQAAAVSAAFARAGRTELRVADLTRSPSSVLADELDANWQNLVRRSDSVAEMVSALVEKGRTPEDGVYRIYVPASDTAARAQLEAQARVFNATHILKAKVEPLEMNGAQTWEQLNHHVGMAYLPKSYVVPGGKFNEMFNWDSVFIAQRLLRTGKPEDAELARNIAENFAYCIEHYGKIPNSNFSYLMSRTQPPLMARLALELDDVFHDPKLLRSLTNAAQKELDTVWRSGNRALPSGLSRYDDDAEGPLSEIPKDLYEFFPDDPEFLRHQRSIRESGHDDTHQYGLEAHHHEPVELNSLLYRYERDLAKMYNRLDGKRSPQARTLRAQAAQRRKVIRARCWDAKAGTYFDHNFRTEKRSGYFALSSYFTMADGVATRSQAAQMVANLWRFLEKGGLATTAKSSRDAAGGESFQWDHPVGWGPLQQIVVEGLRRFGFHEIANEISYRWLHMVLGIAQRENGLTKEKYDVVNGSPVVTLEYGNQGGDRGRLDAAEPEPLGFGWTNSTYSALLDGLPQELRAQLDAGVDPDHIFGGLETFRERCEEAAAASQGKSGPTRATG